MAIARPVRPEVLVGGVVTSVVSKKRREDNKIYRHDVTITQDSGAALAVEFWERDGADLPLPSVGTYVAMVAEVSESRDYGASLGFVREVIPGDLDRLASALSTGK